MRLIKQKNTWQTAIYQSINSNRNTITVSNIKLSVYKTATSQKFADERSWRYLIIIDGFKVREEL